MSHRPQVSVDVGSPRASLASVVEQLQRRADLAEQEGATAPVANVYKVVLAELRPLLDGAASEPTASPAAARLLTADEVADRLRCSIKSVYRNIDRWPFVRRIGRSIRFDSRGLESWLARLR